MTKIKIEWGSGAYGDLKMKTDVKTLAMGIGDRSRAKVYLAVNPSLVRLAFIFDGLKKGNRE